MVVGASAGVRTHVLNWREPLARAAARWLAGPWSGDGPLDLGDWLVVVPTRQSGRRLREALATLAAERGSAVFPPRVVLPETLSHGETLEGAEASRAEVQLAWAGVLQDSDLAEFREVFPVEPPSRTLAWARGLATQLARLQATLAESGLRMAEVVAAALAAPSEPGAGGERDFPEQARWEQLAELERRVTESLIQAGRRDPVAARLAAAHDPVPPSEVRRVALIGLPELGTLAVQVLKSYARRLPVDVVVYGPSTETVGESFDTWGRPRPENWIRRRLDWADFESRVTVCADPSAQAARVVAIASRRTSAPGVLGIGVADPEVLAPLQRGLARAGRASFNPAGRPWKLEGLFALLAALGEVARAPSWDAAATLLRCPDVLAWLESAEGASFSAARLLAEMDALAEAGLPPTLEAGLVQARARGEQARLAGRSLERIADLRELLLEGTFPENASAVLQRIFSGRRLENESLVMEAAAAWTETLREVGEAWSILGRDPGDAAEAWEFALAQFGERIRFGDKPVEALDLNGWLELLWEDAPHLVVAGLNDGRVPEAVVGDAFLPEALRARIGLPTNAERFARDAYLLHAMAASREAGAGRLDVLVGKVSATADPLRPSRLLLVCSDEALPKRVAWLFREASAEQASLPWTRAWQLRPRWVAPPAHVSVTALRDWLECPLRFYFKHGLNMRRVDPDKAELDARDFGTLMHAALQRLIDPDSRDCTDAAVLRDRLLAHFEQAVRARYGSNITLPLVVQFESARQRLRKAAEVQARERAAGWRIEWVERKFSVPLGALTLRGTIDRVDRHVEAPARWRVLDYKTADTPVTASAAHLQTWRPTDAERAAWQRVLVDGKERRWVDLQLPLYRRTLAAEVGAEAVIDCGYFNLPKAAGETSIVLWENLTEALQASAERCAEGVAGAIAAGQFWPPAEGDDPFDDWAELFHQGAAASVAPEVAARLRGAKEVE